MTHAGDLDGVVSMTADNLLVIILQAIDSLVILTMALDPGQCVLATLPVRFHDLRVI